MCVGLWVRLCCVCGVDAVRHRGCSMWFFLCGVFLGPLVVASDVVILVLGVSPSLEGLGSDESDA